MFLKLTLNYSKFINSSNICRYLSSSSKRMPSKLVWIDCEMTGLNAEKDKLLEMAAIITDENLERVDTFGPVCIGQNLQVMDNMNEWCTRQFAKNGLTQRCLDSQLTIEEADKMLSEFMVKNDILKNGILAGNSISTDRIFLDKFCPKFVSHLHYRMVDVSSIKVLVKMWYNDTELYNKPTEHRALSDIQQSIDELRYYKNKYFAKSEVFLQQEEAIKQN